MSIGVLPCEEHEGNDEHSNIFELEIWIILGGKRMPDWEGKLSISQIHLDRRVV